MPTAPVSAVIPAYNAAEHLASTIGSIRSQTTRVEEIIVVDDGSNDDTAEVARSLGARVVRHEGNRGAAAARNRGIRAARCDWIGLLDADDTWKAGKISRQFDMVRSHPNTQIVFSDREHVRGGEVVRPCFLPDHEPYRATRKTRIGVRAYRLDRSSLGRALLPGNFLKPSTLLLHRELFERAGGFDEGESVPDSHSWNAEDWDFALRLSRYADPVVIEEPLVRYRLRDDSLSSDAFSMMLSWVYIADKVFSYPEIYPDGAAEYFKRRKPKVLRNAAVLRMHEGSFDAACGLLLRSLAEGLSVRSMLALAVCLLGEPAYRTLLGIKRSFRLPGLR